MTRSRESITRSPDTLFSDLVRYADVKGAGGLEKGFFRLSAIRRG
jgi:hypothetical protein